MDRAYRRDADAQRAIDELQRTIARFVADPPSRCSRGAREALVRAAAELRADSAHIVRVWD